MTGGTEQHGQGQGPIPTQPVPAQTCRHSKFPKSIGSGSGEGVADDGPEWPLEVNSYDARALLDRTVAGFLRDNLTARQTVAQNNFRRQFDIGASLAVDFAKKNAAMTLRDSMNGVIPGKSADLDIIMYALKRCLDDRFFFGNLTRSRWATTLLRTGYWDLVGEHAEDKVGDATLLQKGVVAIRLFPMEYVPPYKRISWPNLVWTLIHEMVHAFLLHFVCTGETCKRNTINTTGITGHGPVFTSLLALIMREVRTWHGDLQSLLATRRNAVIEADWHAWTRERYEVDRQWPVLESRGYRPFKTTSGRNHVDLRDELVNGWHIPHVTYCPPISKMSMTQRHQQRSRCNSHDNDNTEDGGDVGNDDNDEDDENEGNENTDRKIMSSGAKVKRTKNTSVERESKIRRVEEE